MRNMILLLLVLMCLAVATTVMVIDDDGRADSRAVVTIEKRTADTGHTTTDAAIKNAKQVELTKATTAGAEDTLVAQNTSTTIIKDDARTAEGRDLYGDRAIVVAGRRFSDESIRRRVQAMGGASVVLLHGVFFVT